MRVVYWGTYDQGKPRNRIMIRGLRENGVEVVECHCHLWQGVEDKSQVAGWWRMVKILYRWLTSYPRLLARYLALPDHDAVVVGYLGQFDLLLLWPFATLRRKPLIWDAFLSLYDTMVYDRKLFSTRHPAAWLLYGVEWLACRAADSIVLDTLAHGQYFVELFNVPAAKVKNVLVGAEIELFTPTAVPEPEDDGKPGKGKPFTVLFYGQYIPLHGLATVVRAAKLTEGMGTRWVLIGRGQEAGAVRALARELQSNNIEWIEWVPYAQLADWLRRADVGLGIFGKTGKAQRVIPNKVFQILAAGCRLITGDTPAIRELLAPSTMITLVPVDNPEALAQAVATMASTGGPRPRGHDPRILAQISPRAVGQAMRRILVAAISPRQDANDR